MASYPYPGSTARLVSQDDRPDTPPSPPPKRSFSPTQPLIGFPSRRSFQQPYDYQRPMSPSTAHLLPFTPSPLAHTASEESDVRFYHAFLRVFLSFLSTPSEDALTCVEQSTLFHAPESSEQGISEKVIIICSQFVSNSPVRFRATPFVSDVAVVSGTVSEPVSMIIRKS